MLERGWEVTACDISAAMVELARAKVGDAAELSVADMRELPSFGEFDLVWCLDDAVNYLLSARGAGAGAARDAAQPRPRRAADVRRQHDPHLPHLLRRRGGGRARRPAAGLARARPAPTRSRARSAKRASRSSRWTARRAADPAADAPPAPLPRSRGAGRARSGPAWSASTSSATTTTRSPSSRSTRAATPRPSTSPAPPRIAEAALDRPLQQILQPDAHPRATVTGVDFVTVFVKDYPAALEFYGEVLGLEHSVDYEKIPAGEFETGSLTLQVMDAASIGREFKPSGHPIAFHVEDVEAARGRARVARASSSSARRSTAASATWPFVQRPRRQRPDVPQPLRAAHPPSAERPELPARRPAEPREVPEPVAGALLEEEPGRGGRAARGWRGW